MSYIILLQPVAPIPVSVDATSAAGENVSTESAESNGERPTSPSTKPSALGVGSLTVSCSLISVFFVVKIRLAFKLENDTFRNKELPHYSPCHFWHFLVEHNYRWQPGLSLVVVVKLSLVFVVKLYYIMYLIAQLTTFCLVWPKNQTMSFFEAIFISSMWRLIV